MEQLWRGSLSSRLRIASGLVLFVYALTHFVNIGMGLISPVLMDLMQDWRQVVTRSTPGGALLYAAFVVHMYLALAKLARRGTLRMPPWEIVQIVLGAVIPLMLAAHLVHTRTANRFFDVNDEMGYIMLLIFDHRDGWIQSLLLLIVWLHGCLGLHFWLRGQSWWRRSLPGLAALATLVPAFALAGFLVEGRRVSAAFQNPDQREAMLTHFNFPSRETFGELIALAGTLRWVFAGALALVALVYLGRRLLARRRSVHVRYASGTEILAPKGLTLLEMARLRGVPHAALCGGRGRCTTCRVVVLEGAAKLPPPSEAEARSLAAAGSADNTRLACQIKPQDDILISRVFQPDGRLKQRGPASQGEEKELALLFLDMRGFTARTTGQLPYDVVFLLNRFFDAIVPAINEAGGTVDKYLGDGFLAVFETRDAHSSARAALLAIQGIGTAMHRFNDTLRAEGQSPVAIGIGAHLGDVVLGEIGAASQAPRTLIGDTVNTASRIEGMTKEHRVEALISADLLARAGHTLPDSALVQLNLRGVSAPLDALPVPQILALESLLAGFSETEPV